MAIVPSPLGRTRYVIIGWDSLFL